ncbi:MAG: trypsin-like peptidase domain-containing protein, partial [Clostridia bacterium]|nr:trypsin-like peptidase domain-containing protein [Clostridia bacterium]
MNENNQNGLNPNDSENNVSEEAAHAIPASESVDTSSTEIPSESHKENDEVISEEIKISSIDENTSTAPSPVYRWDYSEQYASNQKSAHQKTKSGLRNYAIVMSVAFLSAIALLIGILFIDPVSSSGSAPLDILYEKCYPSYVAISVVSDNGTSGAGSGIILTEDGYIVTNYHVVDDSMAISVILYDGTTVDADYVDGDEINDIAIIKIAKRGLTPAKIGRSSSVRVGEQVMAIGTPHSINYRGTMTSGYISATNRRYAARNDNGTIQKVV